jgi:hypothetical protein
MPKRRMTPKRKAQIAKWQRLGALARRSSSHPEVVRAKLKFDYHNGLLDKGYTPPGLGGRSHKQGGKGYQHKTGSNFTPAPWVADMLAGKKPTAHPKEIVAPPKTSDISVTRNGRGYRRTKEQQKRYLAKMVNGKKAGK